MGLVAIGDLGCVCQWPCTGAEVAAGVIVSVVMGDLGGIESAEVEDITPEAKIVLGVDRGPVKNATRDDLGVDPAGCGGVEGVGACGICQSLEIPYAVIGVGY